MNIDLLNRKSTSFVLWAPGQTTPKLVIGTFQPGAPPAGRTGGLPPESARPAVVIYIVVFDHGCEPLPRAQILRNQPAALLELA